MYSVIATFYQDMCIKREHFKKQADILNGLITSLFSYSSSPIRILDLACGTGDVAEDIAKNQHYELYGCDISSEMLDEAKKPDKSKVTFFEADWSDASLTFNQHGKFHLIWIMGNSIAHWPIKKLSALFTTIANEGLYPGGIFVCDMRKWEEKNVKILDPSKAGEWKEILGGPFVSKSGIKANVRQKESYLQKVEYELTPSNGSPILTSLTYHIFTCDELKQALNKAGFRSVSKYSEAEADSYPYRVFYARTSS